MRRINIQKILTITIYLFIILGYFWFSMREVQTMTDYITVDEYIEYDTSNIPEGAQVQDSSETKDDNVYQQLQNYQVYYQSEFNKLLFPIIARFSLVFLSASIIFWIVMHKLQKKEKSIIATDITSLKQYQELPEADPVLKQAYKTIQTSYEQHFEDYKRLHSYLSHEQKNALALLQNNLALHEYERCKDNIKALHQGIEDLLTISDSGQDGTLYPVDVTEQCAKVCDDYSRQGDITFIFDENDCLIKAKERWIYRAVANLVDNAVKYGNNKPIEVSIKQENNQVIIKVKDQGIGIEPQQQERIFQHHVRINELNKDGYGIGLSLVRHVVELSEGKIFVESKLNQGTTITLSFPVFHD